MSKKRPNIKNLVMRNLQGDTQHLVRIKQRICCVSQYKVHSRKGHSATGISSLAQFEVVLESLPMGLNVVGLFQGSGPNGHSAAHKAKEDVMKKLKTLVFSSSDVETILDRACESYSGVQYSVVLTYGTDVYHHFSQTQKLLLVSS